MFSVFIRYKHCGHAYLLLQLATKRTKYVGRIFIRLPLDSGSESGKVMGLWHHIKRHFMRWCRQREAKRRGRRDKCDWCLLRDAHSYMWCILLRDWLVKIVVTNDVGIVGDSRPAVLTIFKSLHNKTLLNYNFIA